MTVGELSAVFTTLPVKLRCFYKDHELGYDLSEYADMEVLDVVDFAIQRECREDIYGIGIMTYHNILVLDVLIGDKKEKRCGEPFPCDREKCKGCEEFGWICDYENKVHGYFTCRFMNKKCVDSREADTITPIDFSTADIAMYKD